jgi:uncharacterized protein (TIGR03067 family)
MRTTILGLVVIGLVVVPKASGQEISKRELEKLQGTWTFDSYEEGGKKTPAAELKEKRMFFGANQFIVKKGEELLQVGSLKLDPIDGHRDIDATVVAGPNKGNTMRGIYSLKDNVLKVCIDPEGNERPKEFKTTPESGFYLAVYKRVIPTGEEIDITGHYKAESVQFNGEKQIADVEIKRLGDCYLVKWSKGILDAYVGIGLRKGEVLAVCWANQGQVGACLYRIEKGPQLVGEWTMLGGAGVVQRETLTLRKKNVAVPAK